MDFKESKAIYLQIADRICDEILLGAYSADERVPSVREYAAVVEVNANTVMRSYDFLQSKQIIYNKRGIGYFVTAGADKLIVALRHKEFLQEESAYFFKQLYSLGITDDQLVSMYNEYKQTQKGIHP
ncbi:MAG: GntR family transcriptional regulator [Prevotellaceae bacterium]|jgi:DNA-binding transcriptional regulator YhcF (GntR family)|nr:GntR family transcriptional regulator [Prevotellaceae bacterium]